MDIDNNDLRALAGVILLILATALLFFQNHDDVLNYILLGLAGFLIGGQIISNQIDKK